MINISSELKKILDSEQKSIIDALENYICVSACPGSGKTYTVVKMIEKELGINKDYQGIIACSFTREASEELKTRIDKKLNVQNTYIGTIDSLVKWIICLYVNRAFFEFEKSLLKIKIGNNVHYSKMEVLIDGKRIMKNDKALTINDLTRYGYKNGKYHDVAQKYYKEWLKKLKKNEYEISFPSYYFASYIVKMDIFKSWFESQFTTIYIDEAQDLNYFQHYFFETIKANAKIKIVMVGDPNQSIYQFRGAKPEMFSSLEKKGYKVYKINVSVRCHPSIIYYANKIYDTTILKKYEDKSRVSIINSLDSKFLNNLKKDTFILTVSNKTAQGLYEQYKDSYDIIYSKKIDLDINEFNDYYLNIDIIDELIKYFLNYDNEIDKYKYPYEKIEPFILEINPNIKQKDFMIKNEKINDYLIERCNLLGVSISNQTIYELTYMLEDEKYKYNYYVVEKKNRIMTIHSSKGLEANNVIIYLDNPYDKINDEFKNKLFVAITRAKENVYIISKNNVIVKNFLENLIK